MPRPGLPPDSLPPDSPLPDSQPPRSQPPATGRPPGSRPWGSRPWGTRPARLGISAVVAAAILGMLVTIAAGAEPGIILGVFLVVATVAAALVVRPAVAHRLFPAPAPAYTAAAIIAGLVHDHAAVGSRTGLALGAAQWVASGFIPMTAATGAAVLIAGYRWVQLARSGATAPPLAGQPAPPRQRPARPDQAGPRPSRQLGPPR